MIVILASVVGFSDRGRFAVAFEYLIGANAAEPEVALTATLQPAADPGHGP